MEQAPPKIRRLPFKFRTPSGNNSKVQVTTKMEPLKYSSDKIYMQMASTVKAADFAKAAFLRMGRFLLGLDEIKDLQIAALLVRLRKIYNDIQEFEQLLARHEFNLALAESGTTTAACEGMKQALAWFEKLLENQNDDDKKQFLPLLERIKANASELADLKFQKIDAAVEMEQVLTRVRSDFHKNQAPNLSKPAKRRTVPGALAPGGTFEMMIKQGLDPVTGDPRPTPEEMLKAAKEEIVKAEVERAKEIQEKAPEE